MSDTQSFVLEIGEGDLSPEQRDALVMALNAELRELPNLEVARETGGGLAPGSKAITDPFTSSLVVQVVGSVLSVALPPLVSTVKDWMGRQQVTTAPITLSCNGVTMEISAGTATEDVARIMTAASQGPAT